MAKVLWSILTLPIVSVAFQISYYTPIKKESKAFILYFSKNLRLEEPLKVGKDKALFKEFKVSKKAQKLVIEWKPASPKVKKVLIFTDSGNLFETTKRKIEIYLNRTKVINVYPLTSEGWGIPATIKLEG